jgi:hypothetical protein
LLDKGGQRVFYVLNATIKQHGILAKEVFLIAKIADIKSVLPLALYSTKQEFLFLNGIG